MTPAANQPGTLLEQLAAVGRYLDLPPAYRRSFRSAAWQAARESAMRHARRPDRDDLQWLLPPLADEATEPETPTVADSRPPAIARAHDHALRHRMKQRRRKAGRRSA